MHPAATPTPLAAAAGLFVAKEGRGRADQSIARKGRREGEVRCLFGYATHLNHHHLNIHLVIDGFKLILFNTRVS